MQKPGHIFLFLFALGSVIFGLSLVFPKDKFTLGSFELGFYQPSDLLGTFWNPKEALLEDTQVWTMDTVALDSLPESIVEVIKEAPELDTTLQMGQWDALAQDRKSVV